MPFQLAILAGRDEATYRQLEETEWHAVAHLYGMVPNLPEMMHAADCIMCKAGGLIVTEALACGLPLLLIDVLPGQEAVSGNTGALSSMVRFLETTPSGRRPVSTSSVQHQRNRTNLLMS